jgi:hypothetical protein
MVIETGAGAVKLLRSEFTGIWQSLIFRMGVNVSIKEKDSLYREQSAISEFNHSGRPWNTKRLGSNKTFLRRGSD